MSDDVLIRAEGVSRKFCRDLKRSLWYGVQDTLGDLAGLDSAGWPLRRDEFWAVDDVSFELRRGECLGLIGGNGAGKTTLLKMLNGLIKPDRGRIEMRGRVGALIALGAGFNPVLTGRENIYVNGAVLGLSKREIDAKYDEIVDYADIGDFIDAPVQSYSSGMQVRLGFAIAVAVRPDILLLDEVLAVGDVNFQAKCFNTLASFRERGTSFSLVSHNMHMIARHSQEVLYLVHGRTAHSGDVATGLAMIGRDMAAMKGGDTHEPPDWTVARGSGKIRLTGGEFLNSGGERVSRLDVGERLTLALDYERREPSLRTVKLDVVIRNAEDTIYQGDNLSSGQPLELNSDSGRIFVEFDYIPSNVDCLYFYLTLLDPRSSEVHDWKRNFRLDISPQPLHQGQVFIPSNWAVRTADRADHSPIHVRAV
jgi:lipopolysaccharide transport system ATP-binding protein